MTRHDETYRRYAGMVEESLRGYFPPELTASERLVDDPMVYSLLGGGKRVRGVLALAFYRLFAEDVRPALPFAAALEMIHAYSLIHDDLPCMDDDDMRRGKPSCHVAFGEATALLAGDGLLTLAFETAAGAKGIAAERTVEAIRILAERAGRHGMILGQALDLAGEGKALSAEQLDEINTRKTGALMEASALIGCVLGGGAEDDKIAAGRFGAHLAQAFQIVDDILDETADPAALGKPVGSDRENGKNTYAVLYGVERCRELAEEHTRRAAEAASRFGLSGDFLIFLAETLGKRAY